MASVSCTKLVKIEHVPGLVPQIGPISRIDTYTDRHTRLSQYFALLLGGVLKHLRELYLPAASDEATDNSQMYVHVRTSITLNTQTNHQQVCYQLSTSAVSVALPACAAVRRVRCFPLMLGARRLLVRRYLLPAERPAANSLHAAAAVHRRDRQTDGRTPYCYTDPAPHTMRTVPIVRN